MLFHTWHFLFFFAIVYSIYLLLRQTRFWTHWLLLASCVFYGWWSPLYLLLIIYSTLIDYLIVAWMEKSSRKRMWLIVSIVSNLSVLAAFKYLGFFVGNLNLIMEATGVALRFEVPTGFLLPVGISFYTFQSMSYTIDFYRGEIPREKSFVRFAAYVSLFPQLVAGPIERAQKLLPQLQQLPPLRLRMLTDGASLFVVGMFKKIALADYLSQYVDPVYANPGEQSAAALWLGTIAFAWQIYFDFSGYTDMARGIAKMLGFDLMLNFRHPYLATSIGDFWARWHISLSSWFKDYVYIPLGGNRYGPWRTYRNLFLTMVLSGFWHGAAWKFIIWGLIHGVAAAATRPLERSEFYNKIPLLLRRVFVFLVVLLAWVFFRAANVDIALTVVQGMVLGSWTDPQCPLILIGMVLSIWLYQWTTESKFSVVWENSFVRIAVFVFIITYLLLMPGNRQTPFIYFQF
ncbi:MAG: alginate O-acetyltransferase complex protein AlgI [Pirellulaceae bacterium]|jgi:alginate O-acetyltransferase complex protein AlgI